MPSKVVEDRTSAQRASNGTRSSPRKRKQDPEEASDTIKTPTKPFKRVKRDIFGPPNASPKLPGRSKPNGDKSNGPLALSSDHEVDTKQEQEEQQNPTSTKKKSRTKVKITEPSEINDASLSATRKKTSRARVKAEIIESVTIEEKDEVTTPAKNKRKAKSKVTETNPFDENQEKVAGDEKPKKIPGKRKTKEEKDAEAMPLAARTVGLNMFIGAHVSIATGVEKAVTNCVHIGYNNGTWRPAENMLILSQG